ncbi:hypothetical protein CSKR_100786 [Clonorchis sinensis]|uniref:Uncharacterized protein n=1 Tax=Clonorchis sinensis TaxID=79923 RepID=A0A8T1MMW6_CLOSI|nr:hypothetical protein CSKR_100786 [Clonorchis sinensis]
MSVTETTTGLLNSTEIWDPSKHLPPPRGISQNEQIAAILIAVTLLAILTICIVILIIRTMRNRPTPHYTAHPKNRHPSLSDADRMGDEVKPSYTSAAYANPRASTPGLVVVGLRETPTRKVNKKWYDSTAIPFMDDLDNVNESVYGYH